MVDKALSHQSIANLIDIGGCCTKNSACNSNYCRGRACTEPSQLGDPCSYHLENCPVGFVCSKQAQVCLPTSIKKGSDKIYKHLAQCSAEEYYQDGQCSVRLNLLERCSTSSQCQDGLICYRDVCLTKCIYGAIDVFGCPQDYNCSIKSVCLPKTHFVNPPEDYETVRKLTIWFSSIGLISIFWIMVIFIWMVTNRLWEQVRDRRKVYAAEMMTREPPITSVEC